MRLFDEEGEDEDDKRALTGRLGDESSFFTFCDTTYRFGKRPEDPSYLPFNQPPGSSSVTKILRVWVIQVVRTPTHRL
jgi:hypothetical protein